MVLAKTLSKTAKIGTKREVSPESKLVVVSFQSRTEKLAEGVKGFFLALDK